ncbi:hypothetical protein GGX14DRAFT_436243, partial [Mycena pura]
MLRPESKFCHGTERMVPAKTILTENWSWDTDLRRLISVLWALTLVHGTSMGSPTMKSSTATGAVALFPSLNASAQPGPVAEANCLSSRKRIPLATWSTQNSSPAESRSTRAVEASPAAVSLPDLSDTSSSANPPNPSVDTKKIVWGVIVGVAVMCMAIALLVMYQCWRLKRKKSATKIAPSAAYNRTYVYTPIGLKSLDSKDRGTAGFESGQVADESRTLSRILTPGSASSSVVSLPSVIYEPPELSPAYSPAAESSEGGHSPLNERAIPLSQLPHLVPQRRP